jgi:hypothetical protein
MKKFVVLLLIALLPLEAQQDQLQAEALRAFQSEDYETAKTLFESLVAADPRILSREIISRSSLSARREA